jgi:hypothetical protein
MPTPICASMIIDTSLAPSPIANVIHFPLALARPTTSAFYLGDTLQHITDEAIIPNLKKALATFYSEKAKANVGPSIIIHNLFYAESPDCIVLTQINSSFLYLV